MKITRAKLAAAVILFALAPLPASAARTAALYLDGAAIEQQEIARNGYVEFSLPPAINPESFRIKPGKGVTLVRVVTSPKRPDRSAARELASLADREGQLHDRLKALSVREEIFRAAAKSQSAKAPRRTRTNPEPLTTIKQGTDYALAQLESVYQSQRKTEKELARIADRRSRIQKDEAEAGSVAKVWVTPATASVTASWVQSDRSWIPSYQLRVTGPDAAVLALHANGVTLAKGETAKLYLSRIQSAVPSGYPYKSEATPLQKFPFKLTAIKGDTPQMPLTLSLANSSGTNLPAGDTACFHNGIYMGKGMFQGADAGKTTELICNSR